MFDDVKKCPLRKITMSYMDNDCEVSEEVFDECYEGKCAWWSYQKCGILGVVTNLSALADK